MTRPGWAPSADFGSLPSPDWHAKGLAHTAALRARGGLPVCEQDGSRWTSVHQPRCALCQTPRLVLGPGSGWRLIQEADDRDRPTAHWYCPGCAPFRVPPE